jgi:Holliday junction resolvasome RuvABC endonuclease subunit
MNHTRILAIDPGTKEIGVAILNNDALVYYGVKTVRTRRPPQAVLRNVAWIIKRLIADYDPEVLVIEKTFIIQKSAALLTVVAEEIKAVAGGQGLVIFEYAPMVVRKLICQTGKATKSEVAKAVALRFPELSRYLNRQSKWEAIYWANMFDAVALAVCGYAQIAGGGTDSNAVTSKQDDSQ